jgi:hypothetical protein
MQGEPFGRARGPGDRHSQENQIHHTYITYSIYSTVQYPTHVSRWSVRVLPTGRT